MNPRAPICTVTELRALTWCIGRKLASQGTRTHPLSRIPTSIGTNRRTWRKVSALCRNRFSHLNPMIRLYKCTAIQRHLWFSQVKFRWWTLWYKHKPLRANLWTRYSQISSAEQLQGSLPKIDEVYWNTHRIFWIFRLVRSNLSVCIELTKNQLLFTSCNFPKNAK